MLHGLALDGRTVVVSLAAPLPGDSSRAEISRRVVEAVGTVAGIDRVDVDIRDMTDDEVVACARVLKGEAPPNPPNPLAVVDAGSPVTTTGRPRPRPHGPAAAPTRSPTRAPA